MKRTPLYETHRAVGGRMVEFAGYEMPVRYGSVVEEHLAVRQQCGLFDVSHMGEFVVRGAEAEAFLSQLLPNDVTVLRPGKAHYNALLSDEATFLDDLLVYRRDEDFLLVVNAANREQDWAWIQDRSRDFDVELVDQSDDLALLALQGPLAEEALASLCDVELSAISYYSFCEATVAETPVLLSRTGYTGEDGFELYVASQDSVALWGRLLDLPVAVRPIGLGARDTLRLEAGMMLCGQDIGTSSTPYEAGLGWIVKLAKRSFPGHERLRAQKSEGIEQWLLAFEITERGIARSGDHFAAVLNEGGGERVAVEGRVTSGSWSPSLEKAIGMAMVSLPEPMVAARRKGVTFEDATVTVRGRSLKCQRVKLPFYRRPSA